MTALALTRNEKHIKLKSQLCKAIGGIAFLLFVMKIVFLVRLFHTSSAQFENLDDIVILSSLGIYINPDAKINIVKTLVFEAIMFMLSLIGIIVYTGQLQQLEKLRSSAGEECKLIHPSFIRKLKYYYLSGIFWLVIDSIFVQTFF